MRPAPHSLLFVRKGDCNSYSRLPKTEDLRGCYFDGLSHRKLSSFWHRHPSGEFSLDTIRFGFAFSRLALATNLRLIGFDPFRYQIICGDCLATHGVANLFVAFDLHEVEVFEAWALDLNPVLDNQTNCSCFLTLSLVGKEYGIYEVVGSLSILLLLEFWKCLAGDVLPDARSDSAYGLDFPLASRELCLFWMDKKSIEH